MIRYWLMVLLHGRRCADAQLQLEASPPETQAEIASSILNLGWAVLEATGEEKRRLEADLKARYGVEILD